MIKYRKKYRLSISSILKNKIFDEKNNKVAFLFPVYNDFLESKVLQNAKQSYKNIDYYILDDSDDQLKINEINNFVHKHPNFRLIRRKGVGGRGICGNINYFLSFFLKKSKKKYKYFVKVDADVVVSENYVKDNLPLFDQIENLGAITGQTYVYESKNFCSYLSGPSRALSMLAMLSHTVFGDCLLIGSAEIVSIQKLKECKALPFIDHSIEDKVSNLSLQNYGVMTMFTTNGVIAESEPPNAFEWRRRQFKWTYGDSFELNKNKILLKKQKNVSLNRSYINYGRFLPQSIILSLFFNIIFTLALQTTIILKSSQMHSVLLFYGNYWLWINLVVQAGVLLINFLIILFYQLSVANCNKWHLLFSFIWTGLLFTSLWYSIIKMVILRIFKKPYKFITTVKDDERITLGFCFKHSLWSLFFFLFILFLLIFLQFILPIFTGFQLPLGFKLTISVLLFFPLSILLTNFLSCIFNKKRKSYLYSDIHFSDPIKY